MKYLTGIHALNIPCKLDTCGDWHQSALKWESLTIRDTDDMFFNTWGIEPTRKLPYCDISMPVANHIRALLDLLQENKFSIAQGMNKDFISNDKYDILVLDRVYEMRHLPNWEQIDNFVGKEYLTKWINYKKEVTRKG